MATVTVNTLVETLRRHRLLKPAQLDEVDSSLQKRLADPQALARELLRRGWLTAFQAKQLLLGHGASLAFASYVLLERLGEGGSGQVFKARHQTMDRVVALKVLRNDLVTDKEAVGRFYREIEVISQLSHPAIIHAYDAGVIGSVHFLALEYVEGIDLDRLVRESGRLGVAQACDYIRQAACGLAHAHEKGLVHRDIKPSNLLLTRTVDRGPRSDDDSSALRAPSAELIKLLDLGLARLRQPVRDSRTRNLTVIAGNSVMLGTPDYLAPEQAINFHDADIRADIYSLGCTFYFLLTGQPPFGGGSLTQKLIRHQQAEPPSIDKQRSDVPAGVARILQKMLAKRLPDRYQTPAEVADAIAALNLPTPALPGRTSSTTPTRENFDSTMFAVPAAARRGAMPLRPRWVAAGAVLLVGLVVTLFLLFRSSASIETAGGPPAPPPEPVKRHVLSFNGTNQRVVLPANLLRKGQTVSVEAWFKTAAGGVILGYQRLEYPQPPGEYVPVLYVGTDGLLRGEFWNGASNPIPSPTRVNDDQWHHVGLVADQGAKMQHLYLDGNLCGARPGDIQHLSMIHNQLGTGLTGGWPAGNNAWFGFHGAVAEVRIWSEARSAFEIQHFRARSLTGNEPTLLAWYPLDEAAGEFAEDRSSHRQRATLIGAAPGQLPARIQVLPFQR